MEQVGTNIWQHKIDHGFLGIQFGATMTVIRLQENILLHSPVPFTPALAEEVNQLGKIAYIVAPNGFHHLYAGQWLHNYAKAELFIAPILKQKNKALAHGQEIGPNWPLEKELSAFALDGIPKLNEFVFFHKESKSLIVTDALINLKQPQGLITKIYVGIGKLKDGGVSPLIKALVKDKARAQASLQTIAALPFERILLAHGSRIEVNAKDFLLSRYQWLLS